MWALIKPPILNWLILSFYKYDEKIVETNVWVLKTDKMRASERKSVYLKTVWSVFFRTNKYYKIKFGSFYFQFFLLSLYFHSSKDEDFFSMTSYTYLQQNMIDYIWFFFRKDITFNWTKYFIIYPVQYWNSEKNFFLLQNFLVYLNTQIFQRPFTKLKYSDNILFYNIFFYSLNLSIEQWRRKTLTKFKRKKVFYYALDFAKSIFFNKFEKIIFNANWFLSMQTGVQKTTKYFVDRNYLFATSTQLPRYRKSFFYKFFFQNLFFRKFKTYKKPKEIEEDEEEEEEEIPEGVHIWDRAIQILPFFINKIFFIHNGQDFIWIRVVPGMVGYKLGQFVFTWKIHTRGVDLKNNYRNLYQN